MPFPGFILHIYLPPGVSVEVPLGPMLHFLSEVVEEATGHAAALDRIINVPPGPPQGQAAYTQPERSKIIKRRKYKEKECNV